MHQKMAPTVDECIQQIRSIQTEARRPGNSHPNRPRWPMIILRTPKGWTGPREVDGHKVEGFWRAHQVPVSVSKPIPSICKSSSGECAAISRNTFFDEHGSLIPELRDLAPVGNRRMSANPHANGGKLRKSLDLPDFRDYKIRVDSPGTKEASPTATLATFLRDVMRRNTTNFRMFSPDENASNGFAGVYDASLKTWMATIKPEDADGTDISQDGRVMEMLSEHTWIARSFVPVRS